MGSSRNLQVRHVYRRPIRNTVMPSRTTSLIPPSSVPSSVPVSTSVSFSAPPSSYVSFSTPISVPPVTVPNRPIPPVASSRPTQSPPRPICMAHSRFLPRWPQPMDLDPPGTIVFTPLSLNFDLPASRWPEPMDLDPPGLMVFTPLDLNFDPSSRWPEPMDLDPPGLTVFTPLGLIFSP